MEGLPQHLAHALAGQGRPSERQKITKIIKKKKTALIDETMFK
jgi:hypothetical protein